MTSQFINMHIPSTSNRVTIIGTLRTSKISFGIIVDIPSGRFFLEKDGKHLREGYFTKIDITDNSVTLDEFLDTPTETNREIIHTRGTVFFYSKLSIRY